MDAERWHKAKDIFVAALARDASTREAYLSAACGDDDSLRLEVASLLEAYDTSDGLSVPPWTSDQTIVTLTTKTIGPYHLIRKLGEGGMGQVWLAEQATPVRRQVALKLVRVGIYDDAVLRRFYAERQSLAMMDHPAIAKVFDAGATTDGQPYFVMEYVQGSPITEYCDDKRLTIRERLDLFLDACDGVQHAHQKAIIHRDLKPANLLVVEVDGRPTPRIIDFGLAKAIASETSQPSMLTRAGSFLGTPGYISPEQADLTSEDVDTRTDVYSLGVVLYELLTGVLPIDTKRNQPFDEVLRRLREEDPPRPSSRVASGAESIASARSTQPKTLTRQLRGDLDSIALKALERDRTRRYGSPAELADDIRRFMSNQPVLARPASGVYTLRKFARRNRIGVAAAAVIAAVLVASAVVQAVQLRRITRERDRANRVTDFMTNMFRVADASERRGNTVTAREILDKASTDIERGLAQDPLLQAQMMDVMGSVYSSVGLYSRAQPLLEHAVDIWARAEGADSLPALTSRHNLANTLGRRARYPEAEKLERATFESLRRVAGPAAPLTLQSMAGLAITLENEGRLKEAEQLNREALEVARPVLGADHPDALRPLNSLGNVLGRQARFAEAEKIHTEALERCRRVYGTEHPQTVIAMAGLAGDLRGQGRFADAEKIDRETIEIRRRLFGAEHVQTLAGMIELARDISRQGRFAEAEQLNRQSLDISQRILGPEHTNTVALLINLALNIQQQGRYSESESINRKAIEINRRVLGPEHPYTLAPMSNLAIDLTKQGKLAEAETLARQTLDATRRASGPDHPSTIDSMNVLLACLHLAHKYNEAEPLARQVLDVSRRVFGAGDGKTADAEYELAEVLALERKDDDAIAALDDAIKHGLGVDKLTALEGDADLQSLRGDTRFKALVVDAKRRAAAKAG